MFWRRRSKQADLRDTMVQAQDIHEANSSLQHLDIGGNILSDEGAIAMAQALKVRLVVCSNCSSDSGRGTVFHHRTLYHLRDLFRVTCEKLIFLGVSLEKYCV